jgi:hypothetical protein
MRQDRPHPFRAASVVAAALLALAGGASASSHREAPFITTSPKVDASDFYMFNSYEAGRSGFVTLVANYQPLQDGFDGPNYHAMDANALYEIHIDNVGDAHEHLTFQFRFQNNFSAKTLSAGGTSVDIAPMQNGAVATAHDPHLQVNESYTLTLVTGDRRTGTVAAITNATTGATSFDKPADNIGEKTIADYPSYAAAHIYPINIPGCATPGQGLRRRAPGPVRGEPGRDLRHGRRVRLGAHRPERLQRDAARNAVLQERHRARAGGARHLPGCHHRTSGDRRLDHGFAAPDPGARPDPQVRLPDHRPQRRRVDAGLAPGHAAGQRTDHRHEGQGPVQQLQAQR